MNLELNQAPIEGRVLSSLADDPDLRELVEMYVTEMPQRIQGLVDAVQCKDWERLGSLAHQIKGSAGSYGFQQITDFAAVLEHACRKVGDPEVMQAAYVRLTELMNRAEL